MKELLKQKNKKIKLNVPEKKSQLHDEQKYLTQYKKLLEAYLNNLSNQNVLEINKLIKTVLDKQELVKKIGTQNFNTGILKTVGSEKWEALLFSAKELYDAEKNARKGVELKNCLLCQQQLGEKQLSLYEAYWNFLENTAEKELTEAKEELAEKLESIQNLQITSPSFDVSQPAIKILQKSNAPFVKEIKNAVTQSKKILKSWETKIKTKK